MYRARDTQLERDVAIKVLPQELANDEERVARFEREAKLFATELFSGYFTDLPGPTYDISPDGERFLMIKDAADGDDQLILVHNWFEELKRLVPTND